MNLAGLIALYRLESDDTARPHLVSDRNLTEFANEAQEEACRRAELLRDSTSPMCSIAVAAGTAVITLDPRIVEVRRVKLARDPVPLSLIPIDEMDSFSPGWEGEVGQPRAAVTGYQSGALRLWPVPAVDESLSLTVVRLPLVAMDADDDVPEIPVPYHRALAQWMLYRAYSIQDSELLDSQKAAKCLAAFEQEFGRRQSARNEQWRRERIQSYGTPIA